MVLTLLLSVGVQALAPQVELFMEKCDPTLQCQDKMHNSTDQAHLVDCLAAGMWKEYQPHYAVALSSKCPPTFLKCDSFENDDVLFAAGLLPPNEKAGLAEDGPQDADSFDSLRSGQEGDYDDADAPVRAAGMGDYGTFLTSEVPSRTRYASSSRSSGSHGELRRLVQHFTDIRRLRFSFGQPHEEHGKFLALGKRRDREEMHYAVPPMPKDPIAECQPAETVEQFHQVRLLVPVLLPQLKLYLLVRGVLLLPVAILGCFGFCWGKDLFTRLNDGYNPIGTSNVNPRPQVMLNPALGVSASGPASIAGSTQISMAQPLILNAPPPLAGTSTSSQRTDTSEAFLQSAE
jgi:hypothetical protein